MGRYKKIDLGAIREYRLARNENQAEFWARFGATQSAGSRFENQSPIPDSLALLLTLFLTGVIDDKALDRARKGAGVAPLLA